MTSLVLRRWHSALTVFAVAVLIVASGRTQDVAPGGQWPIIRDVGLPGIDRGLRAQGAPKQPAGRESRARVQRIESAEAPGDYVWGSIIVKFKDGAASNAVISAMRSVSARTIERPSYADFDIVDIPDDVDPEAVAAELRQRPEVEYAQPRYRGHKMARPNDPMYGEQWNFPLLDMERAWDIQPAAGSNVTVAVLDTGIAFRTATARYNARAWRLVDSAGRTIFSYPALGVIDVPFAVAPELGDAKFVAPRDFIWNNESPFDLDGHGTHVGGTIGQLTNNGVGVAGMAYNVKLMPVKVIDEVWDFVFGSPNEATDDVLARGIRYAADNGAKVINMSIGRTGGGAPLAVEDAMRYAVGRGVFIAVAAGNTADEGNAPNRVAQLAPALPGMVAVASVGRSRNRAFYSTTNVYVELAAPGGDQQRDGLNGGVLQQTLDGDVLHTYVFGPSFYRAPRADMFAYEFFQGTSMATPHVSGFAALLIQQGLTSPAAIEAAMKQFATDLGRPGEDSEYGAGLINPRVTLRGLGLAK
jgi:serine protease